MTATRKWLGLALWIVLPFIAAWIGAQVTDPGWYQELRRPTWAPPGWLFGPVWTALYLMMGVAAWLVWSQHGFVGARIALTLFLVQLVFNALWSWVFFGLRQPGWAFVEIVFLWLLILATTLAFSRKRALAAWMLTPYLAWVTFAAALNLSIWLLNR